MAQDRNPGDEDNIHEIRPAALMERSRSPEESQLMESDPGQPFVPAADASANPLALGLGVAAAIVALVAGAYFLEHHRQGVSPEELNRLTQEFPPAIARALAEKRQGSHLNKLEITHQEVDSEGEVHFTYLLSFDETSPNGESTTNTLNQVAVLKRNGRSWSVTAIDPKSQELSFHTELAIESVAPPAHSRPGQGSGTAPASDSTP